MPLSLRDRRQFLKLLGGLSQAGFALEPIRSLAQSTDVGTALRDVLAVEVATQTLLSTPDQAARHLHTLSRAIIEENAEAALSVALQSPKADLTIPDNFLGRLKVAVGHQAVILESSIDPAARLALALSGIAASGPATRARQVVLPLPSNVADLARIAIGTWSRRAASLEAAAQERWRTAGKLAANRGIHELAGDLDSITGQALGEYTIRAIVNSYALSAEAAQKAVIEAVKDAQKNLEKRITSIAATERDLRGRVGKLHSAMPTRTIGSIRIIGSLMLRHLSTEAGPQASVGIQLVGTAMELGLLYATGGISALRTGNILATALGGIGALFGGRSSEAGFSAQMLGQIIEQIASLRRHIDERFDRVEHLQRDALLLLEQIRVDLAELKTATTGAIANLKIQGIEYRRLDKANEFAALLERARGLIDSKGASNTSELNRQATETLATLLRYATTDAFAADPVHTHKIGGMAADDALPRHVTADMVVGLIQTAARVLRVPPSNPAPILNPIEWAKCTQAYLELQTNFPAVPRIRTAAQRAVESGLAIRQCIQETYTAPNIRSMKQGLVSAQTELKQSIERYLQSVMNDKANPTVGKFPKPRLGPALDLASARRTSGAFVISNINLFNYDNYNQNDLRFLSLSYDLVTHAKQALALNFSEAVPRPFRVISNKRFRFPDGQSDIYRVQNNSTGKSIGRISKVLIGSSSGAPVTAWHFEGATEPVAISEYCEKLRLSADFGAAIQRAFEKLPNLNSPEAVRLQSARSAFTAARNSFLILASVLAWRVTDYPDYVSNSTIAALLPASGTDVLNRLRGLAVEAKWRDLDLLMPTANDNTPFAHASAFLTHFGLEQHDRTEDYAVSWHAVLDKPYKYADLVDAVLTNWVARGTDIVESLAGAPLDERKSLQIVDDTLGMFDGYQQTLASVQ